AEEGMAASRPPSSCSLLALWSRPPRLLGGLPFARYVPKERSRNRRVRYDISDGQVSGPMPLKRVGRRLAQWAEGSHDRGWKLRKGKSGQCRRKKQPIQGGTNRLGTSLRVRPYHS